MRFSNIEYNSIIFEHISEVMNKMTMQIRQQTYTFLSALYMIMMIGVILDFIQHPEQTKIHQLCN